MKRLTSFLFWGLIFFLMVSGLDQLLIRVEMRKPMLVEIRTFYVDFRTRLLHLTEGLPASEIPVTKGLPWTSSPKAPSMVRTPAVHPPVASSGRQIKLETPPSPEAISGSAPRYLFTDDKGGLHFADRLEDIPAAYREAAQPFAR